MLIRPTVDDTFECLFQEHHALISGLLASEWAPSRLDPVLIHAVGLHDNPWRPVDADPMFNPETGLPHDFLSYPVDSKVDFYRTGLDELESVHPWVAYLISRHYTTFAGTRDVDALTGPEARRRARLKDRIDPARLETSDTALAWIKFFDVFSLHLCLTGPRTVPKSIPRWLRDPSTWTQAPDATELDFEWQDDTTLEVAPWPFARPELAVDLHLQTLDQTADDEDEFESLWDGAEPGMREIKLVPGR